MKKLSLILLVLSSVSVFYNNHLQAQSVYWIFLTDKQGTTFDPSNIDITFARIDGGMSAPGYLTYKKNTSGLFPVYQEQTNGLWFSLSGLRLSSPPSFKGIYIRNGRKIVIK